MKIVTCFRQNDKVLVIGMFTIFPSLLSLSISDLLVRTYQATDELATFASTKMWGVKANRRSTNEIPAGTLEEF